MQRSENRILTTHVGCLQRPVDLIETLQSEQGPDQANAILKSSVADVVRNQAETGIDIVNDGEYGKSIWHLYIFQRLTGFDRWEWEQPYFRGRDRARFPDFYEYADNTLRDAPGGPTGELFFGHDELWTGSLLQQPVCVGPINYNPEWVNRDLTNLRSALGNLNVTEAFYPTVAPASVEVDIRNEYYKTDEDLLWSLAEALRKEYQAVVEAGFTLQIDDAWMPATWDREPDIDWPTYRSFCMSRIEALNYALRDIPEEKVRYHICWGSWHGPHAEDIPLPDIVDLLLNINAQTYVIEAANARHAHEYRVWERVELPEGKILAPGVVTHSTNLVEHPELVAERIVRFAERVGKENVIAGTDCGMGARIHPELGWGKLQALVEGADLASRYLWDR